ncbi:uncharacterized protein LOC128731419 [Anopheles nili]|uniref:uncharacterized protein LOC128731419 n=1 Tax=Anopheles nili TaxID=185578 RepID=UPI00237B6F2F|nr:uncharacterized protein LOC128731419 [Anopheles nili]
MVTIEPHSEAHGLNLVAHISQRGLHGEVSFSQHNDRQVLITSELETTLQYPEQAWSWGVYQLPVDYTIVDPQERCQIARLGEQLWSFDDDLGYLMLPGNESTTWLNDIALTGEKGLWGKSLVLFDAGANVRICATIVTRDGSQDHLAEARFNSPITGSVYFRWLAAKESNHSDTLIHANLFHVREQSRKMGNPSYTEHMWKIYVTDIFESDAQNAEENCNKLQLVFDPQNRGAGSAIGDIDGRVGALRISTYAKQAQYPQLFNDRELVLLPSDLYGPSRKLYVVVFDPSHPDTFLACAKIRHQKAKTARTLVDGGGMRGEVKDEHWTDTAVIFEYLIHADGSTVNNTADHRWAITDEPPGKDFYDWQNRCVSTGGVYNPFKAAPLMGKPWEEVCSSSSAELCRVGDLSNRLGALEIAGNKREARRVSRRMFIDQNLPLSGHASIVGRSVVIFDDNGPKARGERLACSIVGGYHRRKVVARDWYSNGDPLTIKGKLEIVQQSEYDHTNVEVDFKGLDKNSGYHVHVAPVEGDLEFPCEDSTVYGHWNPRNIDIKRSPAPATGSTDEYELGDLSGKFGTLDEATMYEHSYNDTRLPLFGYESIIGRSIVVHKKEKNRRWACSTLERGYSPNEAREIRAIASFHHPAGYAYGYIRLTQLIGNDNSQSDTIIEVKLRYPGKHDRNVTHNHGWNIWVNPVGVDATVKQVETRCVAAGYVWNPYYTQLADPLNVSKPSG